MTSKGNLPGLPFPLTEDVNSLIDKMGTLDPSSAPAVEPALLSPFWGVGDFGNFSGPPGCGKTLVAAEVLLGAVLARREGRCLGGLFQFDVGRLGGGPVAIIDGEGTSVRWSSIIRRKLEAEGVEPSAALRAIKYVRPSEVGLHNPARWEEASGRLAKALAVIQVRFLICDTLGRIWAPEDINSTAWVQRGLVPFRSACQEYGISALLLSHTRRRKAQDPDPVGPIGSSFQEGQVDAQITMSRMKGGNGLVLTHQKSRRSFWIQQGSKVDLLFRPSLSYAPEERWEQAWPHECPYDVTTSEARPTALTEVHALLRAEPSRTWATREVVAKLNCSERTARHCLRQLEERGDAEKVGAGPQTRWRAAS